MSLFTGAGVAIVTPMHEDETVNYEKLAEILEEQIAGGTDAIIICDAETYERRAAKLQTKTSLPLYSISSFLPV